MPLPAVVIRVEHLSKRYRISHLAAQGTLRDAMHHGLRLVWRRLRWKARLEREEFWALRDISFEVKRGEILGIIGRNGAGKSTLLKILSRITEPTAGRVTLRGRVASLLEVGTGFHPELTGRDNILLNGAILGMTQAEVRRKFDEIVAFAEVEKFIDTPVKHYSSGMYVRLAFAVAAHLEPEILIVDEVLAVGDAEFQKKCLGKMKDVSTKEERTVLFVSHNIPALQGICRRGLVFESGRLVTDADLDVALRSYLNSGTAAAETGLNRHYRSRGKLVAVENVEILSSQGVPTNSILSGDPCTFRVKYRILDASVIGKRLSVSLLLFTEGQKLANLWTNYARGCGETVSREGHIECRIDRWPFRGFPVRVDIYTHIGPEVQDWIENCRSFDSLDGDFYGSAITTHAGQGIIFIDHTWSSTPCH
jgi:lipopolysaccharide transport system ATP-binding protein